MPGMRFSLLRQNSKKNFRGILLCLLCFQWLLIPSCSDIDLYEKSVAIPGHAWKSSYTPSFSFDIIDTNAVYNPMLVLRHTDKYGYNNIWLSITVQTPGAEKPVTFRTDMQLGTDETGWLGSGMNDIYEHRVPLLKELVSHEVSFRRAGTYTFTVSQVMREDPLKQVLDVGLRMEKKQ